MLEKVKCGTYSKLQWKNHNTSSRISGARPGTVEKYSLRNISVCYLALVNTEHLTMEHILFWYLKLPIISLILLDQISHDIRQAQI